MKVVRTFESRVVGVACRMSVMRRALGAIMPQRQFQNGSIF